jgi:magnesium-protoporphyrin O-methyltransferase
MDSLIHYVAPDIVEALVRLAQRTERGMVFTFAPRTRLLAVKHAVGRIFPRSDRAPAIEPVAPGELEHLIDGEARLAPLVRHRTTRVQNTFYISQAMELVRG